MHVLVIGANRPDFIIQAAVKTAPDGKVWVIDPDAAAMKKLEARLASIDPGRVVLIRDTPQTIPLPDESIDRAFIINRPDKITAVERVLQEIRRTLKPDGRLIVAQHFPAARLLSQQWLAQHCQEAGLALVADHRRLFDRALIFQKQNR
jgi:ubiquinone/menaquinone biosynthesis C-methylase UbiE